MQFLQSVSADYLGSLGQGKSSGLTGSIAAPAPIVYTHPVAYADTLVRTGNGSIDVAASGNVDLTNAVYNLANNGAAVVYRNANGVAVISKKPGATQIGGTSLYTAGERIAASPIAASIVGSGGDATVTPTSPVQAIVAQNANFIPSPKGYDDQASEIASGGGDIGITAAGSVLGLRDDWSQRYLNSGDVYNKTSISKFDATAIGDTTQLWRVGSVGQNTQIAAAPIYFTSGIGALGGGNVTIATGASVSDLTVALDSAVTTSATGTGIGNAPVLMTFGRGRPGRPDRAESERRPDRHRQRQRQRRGPGQRFAVWPRNQRLDQRYQSVPSGAAGQFRVLARRRWVGGVCRGIGAGRRCRHQQQFGI